MNLLDIISLAKAGYKKSDIDELLKIQIDESEKTNDGSTSMDEESTSEGDVADCPEESDDKPDYEKMYKDLETQFEKVKNDLKTVQENNRKKDNSEKDVDPMKDLEDVFRSFM